MTGFWETEEGRDVIAIIAVLLAMPFIVRLAILLGVLVLWLLRI